MIEGIGISKKFDDNILFNRLNFKIEEGEFICFSGVSGSGKTTLLNIIGLLEPFDDGKLLFNGKEVSSYKEKLEFYRYDVGFVFQNFVLIENKTVRENLEMVNKKYRTSYSIKNVLERVDLLDKIDSKVYTLSGGEQQRIALARLFFKKSSIVLADEPTGSLDYANAKKVMEILKELNNEGHIVILVTHDEKTKLIADRIIEL